MLNDATAIWFDFLFWIILHIMWRIFLKLPNLFSSATHKHPISWLLGECRLLLYDFECRTSLGYRYTIWWCFMWSGKLCQAKPRSPSESLYQMVLDIHSPWYFDNQPTINYRIVYRIIGEMPNDKCVDSEAIIFFDLRYFPWSVFQQ